MSNYLSNLVAKSLNQIEAVQPRLASLFEPLPKSAESITGQDFNLEQLTGNAISDENEFEARSVERTALTTEETSPTPPPYQPSSAPVQPILTPPSVKGEQPPSHSESLEPSPATREATDATLLGNKAEQQRLPVPEPVQIVTERVVSSKEPPPTAALPPELSFIQTTKHIAPKAIALQPAVTLPSESLLLAPAESTAIPGSTPTPRSSTAVVVAPQVTPSVKPVDPTFIEATETAQPSPTIQVTIGRIEVRATPPAAPSSTKSRSAPPVMSLDEYLRQRGGGR